MAGLIYDDVIYSSGGEANVIESISVNGSAVTPVNKNVNLVIENSQINIFPTANSANEGKILQYTGQTTENLIHGFFYECREDSQGNYSWEPIATSAIYYTETVNEVGGTTVVISTTPPATE